MTKLYLIRHGESEANRHALFAGHSNFDLTDVGHRQAACQAGSSPARSSSPLSPFPAHPDSDNSFSFQEAPKRTELTAGRLSGCRLSSRLLLL